MRVWKKANVRGGTKAFAKKFTACRGRYASDSRAPSCYSSFFVLRRPRLRGHNSRRASALGDFRRFPLITRRAAYSFLDVGLRCGKAIAAAVDHASQPIPQIRKGQGFVLVSDRKRTLSGIQSGIQPRSHDAPRDDGILVTQRNEEGGKAFTIQLLGSLTEGSRDSRDRWPVPCARAAVSSSVSKRLQEGKQMYAPHQPQADTTD
jgi:hypothetical protein